MGFLKVRGCRQENCPHRRRRVGACSQFQKVFVTRTPAMVLLCSTSGTGTCSISISSARRLWSCSGLVTRIAKSSRKSAAASKSVKTSSSPTYRNSSIRWRNTNCSFEALVNFPEGSEIVASLLQPQTDTFRILLIRRGCSQILLSPNGPAYSLPEVAISRCQRTAEGVNAEMKRRWGLEVISLFSPDFGFAAVEDSRLAYFAVESVHPDARPPAGMYWTPISALTDDSFLAREDFRAIREFLADGRRDSPHQSTRPFRKPGWFREVSEWVQTEIRPFELRLNGRFRQFNAAPAFSLIRFETNGDAVWFKAVGEPHLREFRVTLALAQIIPSYVPRLIASRPDWNAWLSVEAEGSELFQTKDVAFWE